MNHESFFKTKAFKKNKKRICSNHIDGIKDGFFKGMNGGQLSDKYGYNIHTMQKYIDSRATKTYIDQETGITWRRCSICRVYRDKKTYPIHNEKYCAAQCRECDNLKKRNKHIMNKNMGKLEENNVRSRKTWSKHSWKYNARRRILRIIGYLDVNGKIIGNLDHTK